MNFTGIINILKISITTLVFVFKTFCVKFIIINSS